MTPPGTKIRQALQKALFDGDLIAGVCKDKFFRPEGKDYTELAHAVVWCGQLLPMRFKSHAEAEGHLLLLYRNVSSELRDDQAQSL